MTDSEGSNERRLPSAVKHRDEMLRQYIDLLKKRTAATKRFIERQRAIVEKAEANLKKIKELIRRTPPGHISDRSDW